MADMRNVIGIAGWKNSGKTHLIVDLVQDLRKRGLTVSTVKHAHHAFDIDHPGKDSFRHREAGAGEVMVASDQRWALMSEHGMGQRPTLAHLVGRMSPADIILAEGFKKETQQKLEVYRDLTEPLLAREDPTVFAVVTPEPGEIEGLSIPVLNRTDLEGIVDTLFERISPGS